MKILLVGAGTVGRAAHDALVARGHEVVAAHRTSAEYPIDLTDPSSIQRVLDKVGPLDAAVCTAGTTPYGPWDDLDRDAWLAGINSKLLGQVELVRRATGVVRAGGSFTLITGILAREPIRTGSVAAAVNGALEAWVVASAGELWGRYRINAVSPTVLTESRDKYADAFPGYPTVDASVVGQAFVRSVESMETGQVYRI
ncbi:NADP-dependent 3-hydroxy acid dehydrogenase YdfG [Kribbella sp. VKM Ac-2527]|uniref:NADP-dependent 3-hydroxy acid dehydrogenase YdfG n=1 Tax=Kribbella caucasensis TaxID=2512215 RepID=A0A4R6KA93_9ACTN|nr:short chain dehydrogenase [Kribbella sp. VKM Ac-2527]TDO46715.1 NADP-dependent 3-hydroxy acid dehydrogenase YdfG [Kribbella sp. VKM Ac-2527]